MILEPKPGRYRLHHLDSPEAEAVLAEEGVTRADLDRALADWSGAKASGSAPSSASTTTACSARRARAGTRTCPTPARSRSSRCSGSRSWSCSAACPRAAPPGSSRTARCRTDRPGSPHLRRRGLAPGGDLFEAPPVAFQHRLLAGPRLPAPDDHVAVLRVELDQPRLAPGLLAGDQGRARARRTGRARCPGSCSSSGSPARPAPPASWSDADRSAPACRRTRRRPDPARRTSNDRARRGQP